MGKKMTRDIIQFVPFTKHENTCTLVNHYNTTTMPMHSVYLGLLSHKAFCFMSVYLQAHETMAEIPKQFISYMENQKIVPNQRSKQEVSSTATKLKSVHLPSEPPLLLSVTPSHVPMPTPEMSAPPHTGVPPYSVATGN